jgi:glycosyltransferase involved in cell wall biosynthesis
MPRYSVQKVKAPFPTKLKMTNSVSVKKLIYILNAYSESDASHFTHILHLLEVMAEQGCEIVLLIEKPGTLPKLKNPSITVLGLRTKLPILRHVELFAMVAGLIRRGYHRTFVRIAAPASIMASLAHRLFGGRSFLWQSGTTQEHDWAQPRSMSKLKWWFSSHAPNWMARRLVHRFVTGPEAMVDYYADVVRVPREKITLLYNDIQIERFSSDCRVDSRACFFEKHTLPSNTLVLLLVHRLSPVRRTLMYLEPMLKALAKMTPNRHWILIVAGGGSELEAAKALVQRLGLAIRVIFLGNVSNRDIPALYSVANIFVHPTYTEGFPRVLIEAMAAGLPIVTTDAGGTGQLLGPKQMDFVVNKNDPVEFARKTIELIDRNDQWPVLTMENKKGVQRFSTPAVAKMYLKELFS